MKKLFFGEKKSKKGREFRFKQRWRWEQDQSQKQIRILSEHEEPIYGADKANKKFTCDATN